MTYGIGRVVGVLTLLSLSSVAAAANLTVTTTGDSGHSCTGNVCTTLRAAIGKANTNSEPDTITLGAGTYTIADPAGADDNLNVKGDFDLYNNLTIVGASSSTTIIDGGGKSRIFDVNPLGNATTTVVTLRNLRLKNGVVASGDRGAAIKSRASVVLDGCVLTANSGTALYSLGSATLNNTSFLSNRGLDDGSFAMGTAIFNQGSLTVSGGVFEDNGSLQQFVMGGAVYFDDGVATFDGTEFRENAKPSYDSIGGAAYLGSSGAAVTFRDCLFDRQSLDVDIGVERGGAIYQAAGSLTIEGSRFSSNETILGGGAIFTAGGSLTIRTSDFVGNGVASYYADPSQAEGGGAIAIVGDAIARIEQSTFLSNDARLIDASNWGLGGAIAVHNLTGSLDIERCVFRGNTTSDSGGAISIRNGTGPVRLSNVSLTEQSADFYGGAIYVRRQDTTPIELASVTIYENVAGLADIGFGGGLFAEQGLVTLHNSVIAANHANQEIEFDDLAGSGSSGGYNAVQSTSVTWLTATDVVGVDPRLAYNQGTDVWGPTTSSFVVDGADPAGCTSPLGAPLAFDVAGSARVIDGNGDAVARCDIGAVELDPQGVLEVLEPFPVISEAAGSLVVTLHRSTGSTGSTGVAYETEDDGAVSGVDYTAMSGSVTWGTTDFADKQIVIPILQNGVVNTTQRQFLVRLSSVKPLSVSSVVATIVDDEVGGAGRIELVSASVAVTEGTGGGTTPAVVTLRRTAGSSGAISVDATRVGGSAVAGRDFDATTPITKVTWANGDVADKTVTVSVVRDAEDEGAEQLTVELSNATGGATLGASIATITINDDDVTIPVPGTVALGQASYSVDEAAGTLTVGVVRTGGADGVVTIDYQTMIGGATVPDFVSATGTLRWENGEQGEKLVVLTIKDDALDESDESFSFLLNGATITGGATLGAPATATITILDDDVALPPGRIALSAATYSVNEQAGTVTIQARRQQGSAGAIDVFYYTTDGTATAVGLDYTPTSGVLHWDSGDATAKTFVVPITNDMAYEGDETFEVVLTDDGSTTPVKFGVDHAIVTIRDNDPAPTQPGVLSFAQAEVDVTEGKKVSLIVSRTGGSDGKVTVQCSTVDGTALAPGDYTAVNKTLVWNDGDSTDKTCPVLTADDAGVDPGETFGVVLSNPSGSATLGATATATVTILDDESTGTLVFSQATYSATESDDSVVITVQRKGGAAGPASVSYTATAGTATTADFTPGSGTLSWGDGDAGAKTFTILLKHDALFESDETVNLALAAPTGAALGGQSTAVLTISDDDPAAGTIEVVATTYAVAETSATATIQVRRAGSTSGIVGISYATNDESATAGSDYTTKSGTLSWADGVGGTQDIVVTLSNDPDVEADETFVLTLATPTGGARLGRSNAIVTILDNDSAPSTGTVVLGAPAFGRGEDRGVVTITATRATGTGAATVTWQTVAGTATADVDFASASGTLLWGDGETGDKIFTINLIDDATYEGDEAFTVSLASATNGITLGAPSSATITIKDDELPPATNGTLSFTSISYSVVEGSGTLAIPVARTDGSTGAVTVKCTTVAGTATAPSDFTATNATLSWANGETATKFCSIPIANDVLAESGELFTVTLNTTTGGAAVGAGLVTVNISDDDGAGRLAFDDADYLVGEQEGSLTIAVVRSGGSEGAVDVNYTTAHDTAKGTDYGSTSGTLHWADGDAAPKSFVVTITDDLVYEGDEAFKLRLSQPTGGAKMGGPKVVTIVDDDPPAGWLSLTKANTAATELDASVTAQVSRKGTLTGAVTVAYATVNQSATAGGDYTTTTGTLSWADGEGGLKDIVVPLLDDSAVEGDETFLVNLSGATGGAAIDRASEKVTIADVEAAGLITLSAATYSAGESSTSLTITATRTAAFGGAVSVSYATANDTAAQPGDYTSTSGILSWNNGEGGSKTFVIPIASDASPEGDETFTITLGSATGGVGIGNSPAVVTIVDDDPFPDLASPPDLALPPIDLAAPGDLAVSGDLAVPGDLAVSVDLASPAQDLVAPPLDLVAPDLASAASDLAPAVTEDLASGEGDLAMVADLATETGADLMTVEPVDQAAADLAATDGGVLPDLGSAPDLTAPVPANKSGCGCATTSSDLAPSWLGALLVLALLQRPRRRARR